MCVKKLGKNILISRISFADWEREIESYEHKQEVIVIAIAKATHREIKR